MMWTCNLKGIWGVNLRMTHASKEHKKERTANTHTAWEDLLPRFVFFPMTGVPKCSGLVRGSWSKVCYRERENQGKLLSTRHMQQIIPHIQFVYIYLTLCKMSFAFKTQWSSSKGFLITVIKNCNEHGRKQNIKMTSLVYWRSIIEPKSGTICVVLGRFSQLCLYVPTVYQLASVSLLMTASLSPPSGPFTSTVEPTWDQRFRTHHCTTKLFGKLLWHK